MIKITKVDQHFVVDKSATYFVPRDDKNISIISPMLYHNAEKDGDGSKVEGDLILTLDTMQVVDDGFVFLGKDIKTIHVFTFKDMYSVYRNYPAQVYPDIGFRNVLCSTGENRWT